MSLTGAERRALKARAHKLKPVVQTGDKGLTDAVLAEAELAIEHHELIKVRLAGAERAERAKMAERLVKALDADMVGMIGAVVILYRPRPQ